jgi:DUF4097 and DUF4098 domain-containing protein YvlB
MGASSDEQNQTQTDRETKTFTLGPNGSLELKNVSGDVSVTSGAGREVRVEITRRSRGRTDQDARLGLQRVTVAGEQQGDRATVSVEYPRGERRNTFSVDVTMIVTAPAGTRINASTVSGDVHVRGMRSDVMAKSVSGNVEVAGAANNAEARSISGNVSISDVNGDAVTLGTVSGDVIVDRVTVKRIEGETTSGVVRATGASADNVNLRSLSGDVVYSGVVARGGRYELQSHSGNITFEPSGSSGYQLDATTFSGTITPPGGMSSARVSSQRSRMFHGTVGSGSATVSIVTFSGDVVVRR